ncbi:B3/B4 domain-containing protein [Pseudonocardia sp. HH130630-07]|uniref:B3/B4 domain-containing protein n=1 Tax=Pseudonocardia sp. HH130630-07 TaxID=1690815 RepID=UPI0008153512|nr:phenylalanine--tRNA ligase beta subunit-related protein [Pseudonocardia sp. HH130630-07]ANY08054.1 hypothetical protein AFB00_19130 [Pseudonocardia sp. HH130630-07]
MQFTHDGTIWDRFPELAAAVLAIDGVDGMTGDPSVSAALVETGLGRLAGGAPSELPEISAWRRAFQRMGLKPTQYRCASEALLRRVSKERALPHIHPLVDLCNAVSVARAVPVAAFDLDQVQGDLGVRPAHGTERYETFGGEVETPPAGEVVFVDDGGRAHARRWTNRQAATSAVRPATRRALIVIEALHATAAQDVLAAARDIEGAVGPGVRILLPPQPLTRGEPVAAVPSP